MMRNLVTAVLCLALLGLIAWPGFGEVRGDAGGGIPVPGKDRPPVDGPGATGALLPEGRAAGFVENRGQVRNEDVLFYSADGSVWFTATGAWLRVDGSPGGHEARREAGSGPGDRPDPETGGPLRRGGVVVHQEFLGAGHTVPEGRGSLLTTYNYMKGREPSGWVRGVPVAEEVWFTGVWDGIDVRYHTAGGSLKYDIIVTPGADPADISIAYRGADHVAPAGPTSLVIGTAAGAVTDGGLFAYQEAGGARGRVEASFTTSPDGIVTFDIGSYDRSEPLVIDPALEYCTYLGGGLPAGSGDEWIREAALDSSGNLVLLGYTEATDFPTTPGAWDDTFGGVKDVCVSKLTPDGSSLIYSTYLGGSGDDRGLGLFVDDSDFIYLSGYTESSPDFPVTAGAYQTSHGGGDSDAFVLKMSAAGDDIIYCTYLGGDGTDLGRELVADGSGNAFVCGQTGSADMPATPGAFDETHNGVYDAFLAKVGPDGSTLPFFTYLGGEDNDNAEVLRLHPSGDVLLAGLTNSSAFPTTSGAFDTGANGDSDMFVARLYGTGSDLVFSTFLGGAGFENCHGVLVDGSGDIAVAGVSGSADYPVTPGAYSTVNSGGWDAVVSILSPDGSTLVSSTYVGGEGDENGRHLSIGPDGDFYVTGNSDSTGLPVTHGATQGAFAGGETDGMVLRLDPSLSHLKFCTYLGGSGWEWAVPHVLDAQGYLHVAGVTDSSDLPVTAGAYDTTYNGGDDMFAAKLSAADIQVTGVTMLRDGTETGMVYCGLPEHTVRVTFTEGLLPSDDGLEVFVTPSHSASAPWMKWSALTGDFTVLSPGADYVTLAGSSEATELSPGLWRVDFDATFDWDYPTEGPIDLRVMVRSEQVPPAYLNLTDAVTVENDLTFSGSLSVAGSDGRPLGDGDHVGAGEELEFSGLTPVYEGAETVYPDSGAFSIVVEDDEGGLWEDQPSPGQPFGLSLKTPDSTDDGLVSISVCIGVIPDENDASDVSVAFALDTGSVTFSGPTPGPDSWMDSRTVEVGIVVTDSGGGEVDGSSVYYSTSRNRGGSWSGWKQAKVQANSSSLEVFATVGLDEGSANLVRWMACDVVGNGPAVSPDYPVKVDVTPVLFSGPVPGDGEVVGPGDLQLGINVTDEMAGVDAHTVEYSVSPDEGVTWSGWTTAGESVDGVSISATVGPFSLPDGEYLVRWRASDMAGNGPALSPSFAFTVDGDWHPPGLATVLEYPANGGTVTGDWVVLSWRLEDPLIPDVSCDIYMGEAGGSPSLLSTVAGATSFNATGLDWEGEYSWTVVPRTDDYTGECLSGTWTFTTRPADLKPVRLTWPPDGARVEREGIELRWDPLGGDGWTYDVYLGRESPPGEMVGEGTPGTDFAPGTLLPGDWYWMVIPVNPAGERMEGLASGRTFVVEGPGPGDFGVELDGSGWMTVEPGASTTLPLEVRNTGVLPDEFHLTFLDGPDGVRVSIGSGGELSLDSSECAEVTAVVLLPDGIRSGMYNLTFRAVSRGAESSGYDVHDHHHVVLEVKGGGYGDPGGLDEPVISLGGTPVTRGELIVAGVAAAALVLTLPLWLPLLLFLLAPLMVRVSRDRKDNIWRDRILAAIVSRPGVHFNALKGWLEISNGPLIYNLERLVSEGRIVAKRDGFFKRYYPVDTKINGKPPEFMDIREKILIIVRDNPGAAQSEMAHLLDESRQRVHYHVRNLEREGVLESTMSDDGHPRYYLSGTPEGRRHAEGIRGKRLLSRHRERAARPTWMGDVPDGRPMEPEELESLANGEGPDDGTGEGNGKAGRRNGRFRPVEDEGDGEPERF